MQIKTLYRIIRTDGGITVSPIKPNNDEYTEMYRLIADEGKVIISDGINTCQCIDVETYDRWYEIDTIQKEIVWGDIDV